MNNCLVYDHFIVPVKLHYYGYTGNDVDTRKTKGYKRTALELYINQYGWDNISTTIVTEGLTKKEAELLENKLIKEGWKRGDCINRKASGGYKRDNPKEYDKQYYEEHRDERKEYYKQVLSTQESKIYKRVQNYNRNHTTIETPMEAKNKYLEYGYIPSYIKNDDLK